MTLNANNIVLVEGFDMVGKNTYVKKNFPHYCKYFEYDHTLTDITGNRDKAWIAGYGIISFLDYVLKNTNTTNLHVAINRGVLSSVVYEKIYNRKDIQSEILDWYKNNSFFTEEVKHVYVRHHNADTAREIYNKSISREEASNEINKSYDSFNSFEDYWMVYSLADQLFMNTYKHLGIKPTIVETLPNFEWEVVDGD